MTSANFSGFWTPSPLVRIWDWYTVLNSCNLPYYIFFWANPPPPSVRTSYMDARLWIFRGWLPIDKSCRWQHHAAHFQKPTKPFCASLYVTEGSQDGRGHKLHKVHKYSTTFKKDRLHFMWIKFHHVTFSPCPRVVSKKIFKSIYLTRRPVWEKNTNKRLFATGFLERAHEINLNRCSYKDGINKNRKSWVEALDFIFHDSMLR